MSQSVTSLDDLLVYDEPEETERPVRRQRTGLGWWVRALLGAAALTTVTVVGLRLFGMALPVVGVAAGWLALILLGRTTRRLAPAPPGRRRSRRTDDSDYPWRSRDAITSAVHRWESRLSWAEGERDRLARAVLPHLRELVDERLRQRHGISRETDPQRARTVLGEPLWTFLTDPPRRSPGPRDYATLLAELEKR